MGNKKLIFILGNGRSGTTLLNKVLSAHPNIHFISREFNDLPFFYFNSNLYTKQGITHYDEMANDFVKHPMLNLSIGKICAKDFREMLDAIFDSFRKKERKNIIGIKVSNYILENIDMLKSIFNDAYFIHIIRDPRDVYISLRKAGLGGKSPFYFAKSWKEIVNKISALKDSTRHYYEIRYEHLIKQPEKQIKWLCDFLGIKFSKEMLHFYEHVKEELPVYHKLLKKSFIRNNFNKWKKILTKKELDLIYAGAGNKIYELGYSEKLQTIHISFLKRSYEYFQDKAYLYFKLLDRHNREEIYHINGWRKSFMKFKSQRIPFPKRGK